MAKQRRRRRKRRKPRTWVAIPRTREKGPEYFPQEYCGSLYLTSGQKVWDRYIPQAPPYTYLKRYEECSDALHPGPPYRTGGSLFLRRMEATRNWSDVVNMTRGFYRYQGAFTLLTHAGQLQPEFDALEATAADYGPSAWKKASPTKPIFSAGQFYAELRDIRKMAKVAYNIASAIKQGAGAIYLSYEFGWKLFARDVRDLFDFAKKAEKRVAFLRKNNGKWIKRKGTVEHSLDTVETEITSILYPTLPSYFYPGFAASKTRKRVLTLNYVWYEGAMRYYIPDLEVDPASSVINSRVLRHLAQLELGPSLVWECLPWSWLVDWFSNVGDVMANLQEQSYNNLVAKYFYVMRTRVIKVQYHHTQTFLIGAGTPGPTINVGCRNELTCKERSGASAFGFGISEPNFTPRQLAILGALAMSRGAL